MPEMNETPDRENVIALLEKLGDPDDGEALSAARQLHGLISETGLTWDDLLVPDGDTAAAAPVELDDESDDDDSDEPAAWDDAVVPSGEAADDVRQIERLLDRKDISADLREELEGYKEDIREGEFTAADRKYLAALGKRLTRGPKSRSKE